MTRLSERCQVVMNYQLYQKEDLAIDSKQRCQMNKEAFLYQLPSKGALMTSGELERFYDKPCTDIEVSPRRGVTRHCDDENPYITV